MQLIQMKQAEVALERVKQESQEVEIGTMKKLNKQLNQELKIIKWSINFYKDGRNVKQIQMDYEKAMNKCTRLEKRLIDQKEKYTTELVEATLTIQKQKLEIKKLDGNIVKPLMVELKVKEEIISRLHEELGMNTRDMK